jgi:hypothetical protein
MTRFDQYSLDRSVSTEEAIVGFDDIFLNIPGSSYLGLCAYPHPFVGKRLSWKLFLFCWHE